ncbi:hypothetical protein RvY_17227 [Ramazzottius varieornatus]|uniref:Histone H2A n=1 Tax=Ramazzottius varieornatus TaxID=947166 RepID=A0A1D1W8J7_RAMVA|nr:hypothetical protein RvY_17227 [Ramazzottius varieornatus]
MHSIKDFSSIKTIEGIQYLPATPFLIFQPYRDVLFQLSGVSRRNLRLIMFGRGGKTIERKKRSVAARSGLTFPVSRFHRQLKNDHAKYRISRGTSIFAAAVIEYMVAEVLELAGKACADNKKKRITPRHIQLAVRNDEELNKFCEGVQISQGGVMPNVHPILMKPVKEWRASDTAIQSTPMSERNSSPSKNEKVKTEKRKSSARAQ